MTNLIGRSLGRYHILEQLGEGGMAAVYKAYDTRLERDVAIKVILAGKEHSAKFLKRFEREAKALGRLSHPNIVGVIDFGDEHGLPYLVMEYLPGGTLKQKLTGKPMSCQQAVTLLVPIARALAYAHSLGIIHRDIKPANILITQSGEPMLSDFGIAKLLESEETLELTGTGAGVGTPEYMSPEQAQAKPVEGRSDVYSLGIVFYEMVTGRRPYQADTPLAVAIKQATEPLPRPGQFVAGLPDEAEKVLLKALAKNPENRFHNMNLFADALQALSLRARDRNRRVDTLRPKPLAPGSLWLRVGVAVMAVGALAAAGFFGLSRRPAATDSAPSNTSVAAASTKPPNAVAADTSAGAAGTATHYALVRQANLAHQGTATARVSQTLQAWLNEALPAVPAVAMPSNVAFSDLLYQADFNSPSLGSNWQLDVQASRVDGILRQPGRDWAGNTRRSAIRDGNGVLFLFRCTPGSEAEMYVQHGDWNMNGMRRWGVYCEPDGIGLSANVAQDTDNRPSVDASGDFRPKRGDWIALLLVIGGQRDFLARAWAPTDPAHYWQIRQTLGAGWAGLDWTFTAAAFSGEVDITRYQEVRLAGY